MESRRPNSHFPNSGYPSGRNQSAVGNMLPSSGRGAPVSGYGVQNQPRYVETVCDRSPLVFLDFATILALFLSLLYSSPMYNVLIYLFTSIRAPNRPLGPFPGPQAPGLESMSEVAHGQPRTAGGSSGGSSLDLAEFPALANGFTMLNADEIGKPGVRHGLAAEVFQKEDFPALGAVRDNSLGNVLPVPMTGPMAVGGGDVSRSAAAAAGATSMHPAFAGGGGVGSGSEPRERDSGLGRGRGMPLYQQAPPPGPGPVGTGGAAVSMGRGTGPHLFGGGRNAVSLLPAQIPPPSSALGGSSASASAQGQGGMSFLSGGSSAPPPPPISSSSTPSSTPSSTSSMGGGVGGGTPHSQPPLKSAPPHYGGSMTMGPGSGGGGYVAMGAANGNGNANANGNPNIVPPVGGGGKRAERYGLMAMLPIIRLTNPDVAALSLGIDLTSLGLDLSSQDPLYPHFTSPLVDSQGKKDTDTVDVHPSFYVPSVAPPQLKRQEFKEDTLFYMFYSGQRTQIQALAAAELYDRGWRFHRETAMWLMPVPGREPTLKTATHETRPVVFFNPAVWERQVKADMTIVYEQLEGKVAFNPPE